MITKAWNYISDSVEKAIWKHFERTDDFPSLDDLYTDCDIGEGLNLGWWMDSLKWLDDYQEFERGIEKRIKFRIAEARKTVYAHTV